MVVVVVDFVVGNVSAFMNCLEVVRRVVTVVFGVVITVGVLFVVEVVGSGVALVAFVVFVVATGFDVVVGMVVLMVALITVVVKIASGVVTNGVVVG